MPMYSNESTGAARPQYDADKSAEDGFCRFFDMMAPKVDGLVRLFDRGEYYTAHGADAFLVSEQVHKGAQAVKYWGSGTYANSSRDQASASSSASVPTRGLATVTVKPSLTKTFLRDALTTKQMRIEIYIPDENPAGSGRKDFTKWKLERFASPGNITQVEDLLFSNDDMLANAVSMAVKIYVKDNSRTIGAAFVDVQEKLIGVAEYVEDDSYGNTESLLIQLGVKECIIQLDDKQTDHELTKLRQLVERCGIIITERKAADFQGRNVDQDLNRLLDQAHSGVALPEFDLKYAMSALSALLIYMDILSDSSLHGQFRLHHHDLSQYMKLDASALKALNLMPNPQELGGNKNMSLYGLLNKCKTSQGQRLLARWLKQPLVNLHEIAQRQTIVDVLVNDSNRRRQLQGDDRLRAMPDFHRITKKFHRRVAGLEDLIRVYQAVLKLPNIIDTLEKLEVMDESAKELIDEVYLNPLRSHAENLQQYVDMIEETVDLEEVDRNHYLLRATFDDELLQYKEQLMQVRNDLDQEHERVGKDLKLDIEKKLHLEKHQVYKYSFRITKAEAGLLRGKKQYYELSTQKSGTIFTTNTLRDLSEDYYRLQDAYEKKQRVLVKEVVDIASSYTPVLEILDNLIAAIDVTVSFAHVSSNAPIPYVKPVLSEKGTGDVVVRGARHPCLEVQDDVNFIPNDHEMKKGSSEFIVLTGPNMGGKSTYIRQIGVIALMAQIGCFVPADQANLPVFDCILARVGAGDSQLKGVSTFMAEMLETATILKSATKDSLIIIDELGRGTSTYDGFGLAWAISEHIASKIRAFCLFATHFHELTTLDQTLPHVKNLHVEALVQQREGEVEGAVKKQDRNITLLYQVKEGICDQSFGIHVAELANFPDSVVRLAKRKAEELEDFGDGTEDSESEQTTKKKFTQEESDSGSELLKEFFDTWHKKLLSTTNNGEIELDEKEELDLLKLTVVDFQERFEDNPWVRNVVAGL